MKKILVTMALITTVVSAGTITAKIPKGCIPQSSEYSTGGGDKAFQILEIMCKMPNGTYASYIDTKFSAGGFFGVGRVTAPDKIIFKEHNKDSLEF